jgi:hypothetical protein
VRALGWALALAFQTHSIDFSIGLGLCTTAIIPSSKAECMPAIVPPPAVMRLNKWALLSPQRMPAMASLLQNR